MSEFLQQDDARRSRILEAALKEFAEKGYKKASTNTIVREAEVSKGLLFHYFISKKDLFLFIYQHAINMITEEMYENVNFADRDVLNRMKQATLVKIDSYLRHPLFVQLFEKSQLIKDKEIIDEIIKMHQQVEEDTYNKIFSNIDYYAFNDALNIDRCLSVVRWTVDKISKEWQVLNNGNFNTEAYESLKMDIGHYLDLFREAFYRK
jgi:AcrR family transcriptional regulator